MTIIAPLHALLAEFEDGEQLAVAARQAREAGYRNLDAYTPYPDEAVTEALGLRGTRLPFLVLIGALLGGGGVFLLQQWIYLNDYPINIAGRPLDSWPAFMVATYEMTILFGAFFGIFGMLILNGLPSFYHPVFNVERFIEKSGTDGFFLSIEAKDPQFSRDETRRFLLSLGAREVWDVPE